MRNVSFVAWMLGWPWLISAYPGEKPLSEPGLFVFTVVWIFVASLVYERRSKSLSAAPGEAGE